VSCELIKKQQALPGMARWIDPFGFFVLLLFLE
jgi:hypothetical protein